MIDPDALTELLEKVGDAVLRVDAGGLVTGLSPRAEALTGRTALHPAELLARLVGKKP